MKNHNFKYVYMISNIFRQAALFLTFHRLFVKKKKCEVNDYVTFK